MGSQLAYNYLLSEVNNTVSALEGCYAQLASLTAVSRAFERTITTDVLGEINKLAAAEPTLDDLNFLLSDTPVLHLTDTRGSETFRIFLPSTAAVRQEYFTFLSGSGYNPNNVVEAQGYYNHIDQILAAQVPVESRDFGIVEALAEEAEKQMPALLDQLHIYDPPNRERLITLAWEAGDGDDRARELLGYTLTSFIMSREVDDYSVPGQNLTLDRIRVRLSDPGDPGTASTEGDEALAKLDEINGNVDTQILTGNCFTGLDDDEVADNQADIADLIRYLPGLHSSGGISDAYAKVQENVTDPDLLAEASAELVNKGTAQDPILLALQKAAASIGYKGDALLWVEAQAHTFLSLSESLFGASTSPNFRTMVALGPDQRLSGFRRREAVMALRQGLIPTGAVALASDVEIYLWMLAHAEIDINTYTSSLWAEYIAAMPQEYYWGMQAFVDKVFISPEIIAEAQNAALEAIKADMTQEGTGLTTADPPAFDDILTKLATIAVTPEDRQVQFDRLRDIGQRMSVMAPVTDYRYWAEVYTGGGYLADTEYPLLYANILEGARQYLPDKDPVVMQGELAALGNLDWYKIFVDGLVAALQEATGNFFTSEEIKPLTECIYLAVRIGVAATMYDRYWNSISGADAALVFNTAVQLSRDINTLEDQERLRAVANGRLAIARINGSVPDIETVSELFEFLCKRTKTPQATQEESDFLTKISNGDPNINDAYLKLDDAVKKSVWECAASGSGARTEVIAIGYYPLQIFSKNNEYCQGITDVAINGGVQQGSVLPGLGNSYTVWQGEGSVPYGVTYHPKSDIISNVLFDPNKYTWGGEHPAGSFNSGLTPKVKDCIPDLRTGGGNAGSNLQSGASSNSSNLQNMLCKIDALCDLMKMLNGAQESGGGGGGGAGGAITGGINNAIQSLNDTVFGLTGKMTGLLKSAGNMGSINMKVQCKCMSFDLSTVLKKMIAPIDSWLKGFGGGGGGIKNPFQGAKNPFHLNPNMGCPKDLLGGIGGGGGLGGGSGGG
jgi:hypothetical protein